MIVQNLVNLVRDGKYSAMKFMKFFVNQLVNEKITLIREQCMNDLIFFLSYLRAEDIDRVSIILFTLFIKKIQESSDEQSMAGYVSKALQLLNNETNIL